MHLSWDILQLCFSVKYPNKDGVFKVHAFSLGCSAVFTANCNHFVMGSLCGRYGGPDLSYNIVVYIGHRCKYNVIPCLWCIALVSGFRGYLKLINLLWQQVVSFMPVSLDFWGGNDGIIFCSVLELLCLFFSW